MQFDEYYSCILGGYVNSVALGSEVERDMSKFGVELLYINAGLVEQCKESDDFRLLTRSVALLENLGTVGNIAPNDVDIMRMSSISGLLRMFQLALWQRGNISYPRSFRLSDRDDSEE